MPPFAHLCEVGEPPPRSEQGAAPVERAPLPARDHSRGPYAQTLTGGHWYPFDPLPSDVRFADLRALSRVNRYGGHTLCDHYSVADHSIRVAWRAHTLARSFGFSPEEARLAALGGAGHDAHEAYPPGDQIGPFLRAMKTEAACSLLALTPAAFEGLLLVVARAESVVRVALGISRAFLDPNIAAIIKRADMELLATERRDLMAPGPVDWGNLPDPLPERIIPRTPKQAWEEFQGMWEDFGGAVR